MYNYSQIDNLDAYSACVQLTKYVTFGSAYYANYTPTKTWSLFPPHMTRKVLATFKTELCHHYINNNTCPFFASCRFAHGEGRKRFLKFVIDRLEEKRRNPVDPSTQHYKPSRDTNKGIECIFAKLNSLCELSPPKYLLK
jgi:hypothetical protein